MAQSRWKYVFTDLVTGKEKAALPMVGVSFEDKLLDIGTLEGIVPTTDPAVRALDPWTVCAGRRTGIFVEQDDEVVWGGILFGTTRSQETYGIKLAAASFESWLNYAFLWSTVNTVGAQLGAPSTFREIISTIQTYQPGSIGITVTSNQYPWTIGQGGDGTGENKVPGQAYGGGDLKSVQDMLVGWAALWNAPIEWRFDLSKRAGGGYNLTLIVTEDGLDAGRVPVELRYGVPQANLLTFTDTVDGTQHPNAVVAAINVPAANTVSDNGLDALISTVATADDVGVDELASGYPLLQVPYSLPSNTVVTGQQFRQSDLDPIAQAEMLDRLAQGNTISNLTVRPDLPRLTEYAVGDPANLEITHPAYREFPLPTAYDGWRIVGRKVTPGSGTSPDVVTLTVVPSGDRIPNSRTVSAEIKRMAGRLRAAEIHAGL